MGVRRLANERRESLQGVGLLGAASVEGLLCQRRLELKQVEGAVGEGEERPLAAGGQWWVMWW